MRTKLRVAALVSALLILAFWFVKGRNPGWTKTSVLHTEKDPVTELEKQVYEDRFVPGVDFLAAGLGVAILMAGCSFLVRAREKAPPV
jgi:hypothetical protein